MVVTLPRWNVSTVAAKPWSSRSLSVRMTSSRLWQSHSPGSNQRHWTSGSSIASRVAKSPRCHAPNPSLARAMVCSLIRLSFVSCSRTDGRLSDTGGSQRFPAVAAVTNGDDPAVAHREHSEVPVVRRSHPVGVHAGGPGDHQHVLAIPGD